MTDGIYTLERESHFSIGTFEKDKVENMNTRHWGIIKNTDFFSPIPEREEEIESLTEAWEMYISNINNKENKNGLSPKFKSLIDSL
jgi:hypothetical protein